MAAIQKPNWEKDYTQIWTEFRDSPFYKTLHEQELWQIHLKWKKIAAEVK